MIHTMRWFGPNDPVSLMDIRQAGCSGIVTALHQIPVGDVWSTRDIKERKLLIEEKNHQYSPLHWSVVESLPVHEDIKKGLPTRTLYIDNYKQSLRNLATNGIKTVCYNFMPVLDWSRTALDYPMPEGAKTLRFVWVDFAIFDLFILRRPHAEGDYEPEVRIAAENKFQSMSSYQLSVLTNTVLLGLPGSEEAFDLAIFQSLLDEYKEIGDLELRKNLYYFISQVAPLAQELGVNLCIHPDDPPRSLLGLPRVVSTESDFEQLMNACNVTANGITFCTGSLGVREDNDLPGMIKRFGDRIHFVHLRTTRREEGTRNFHEAPHLNGDVDMYDVVKALLTEEKRRKEAGHKNPALPMRPDHGFQMLDDLQKKTYPGYSAIGRLKALAELRGLELGISRSLQVVLLFLLTFFASPSKADDGYRLWLKYDLIKEDQQRKEYAAAFHSLAGENGSPVSQSAIKELQSGFKGLLGKTVPFQKASNAGQGSVILKKDTNEKSINAEGYHIYRQGKNIVIAAKTDQGLLYGSFAFLRHLQTGQSLAKLDITSSPKIQFRMLNHWDNPNGTIERGYAGASLWKWFELPERLDPRYTDYARANASIGINSTVVNNVNASARFLTPEYLPKVQALADVFRPYGIKVFMSVNFAAPKILGGLPTSDPLDPKVRKWWADKTKEIYASIPDFGGFLVKANSEGEPGPQDYGRNHADGANMLAEALEPYQGIVIWRAFVYKADANGDRFKAAYDEFKPLDGQFKANAMVQVKNGPIDFQPREPFSPLFGAMPKTPLAMEFQITQEYLGFTTNLVYLAPLFKECLEADTYVQGKGSTVAKIIDGSLHQYQRTAIAGVANTGSDRNWTGHTMSQANWYAYGRLAWDYSLSSASIAEEWIKMTLTRNPKSVEVISDLLEKSRENYVNFTTPLGLNHLMGENLHFGPQPWLEKSARPDWTAIYYHRADEKGIGFDRTKSGSNALAQYSPEIQKQFNNPETCPLPYLLWFHHIPWDKKLSSGRTLWDELCFRYYSGAESVSGMLQQWETVKSSVDPALFADVTGRLKVQKREALWWRDACVLYFQEHAKLPIPAPYLKPERTLNEIKKITGTYQLR
jgi:mannonate dehydratase